jgi:TusA-related sulfurtransferase
MIKTASQVRAGDIVTLLVNKRPTAKTIREVSFQNGNVVLKHSAGEQVVTPNSTLEVAEPTFA